MVSIGPRLAGVLAAASAISAIAPAAAHATITHTHVTSAGPPFAIVDEGLGVGAQANGRIVKGTSDGTQGTDAVDLKCVSPDFSAPVESNVPVGSGGSFAATVDGIKFQGDLCRMIAVPAGTNPSDLTPFTGPVVGEGRFELDTRSTDLSDYFLAQPQRGAYNDYNSLGNCGLCDVALYGSNLHLGANYLWFGNAALLAGTYTAGGRTYPDAQVDGNDVLTPKQADAFPGAPALSFSHTIDKTSGNTTITEVDPLVRCATSACSSYVSAGLSVNRHIVQNQHGLVVRITDVIRSTDGQPHTYAFAYAEKNQGTSHNAYRFPGQSSYHEHTSGDALGFSSSPIQTISAIADNSKTVSVDNPAGAMTVSPAPALARFGTTTTPAPAFNLVFQGTVPAGGARTIRHYFAIAASQAQVNRLAAENVDALGAPAVTITQPAANGTTVHTATITVAGRASDNRAVTRLTVGGRAVALTHGAFSTTLRLKKGLNTIRVVASDAAGNRTTAQRMVRFVPR